MRRLLLVPVLLLAAYMAWPLAAAWQLRTAVKARDIPAIERKVDWQTLRANLKQTIGGNLRVKADSPERNVVTRVLIRSLGPLAAGAMIEMTVTPHTIARVLAGRTALDGDVTLSTGSDAESGETLDPLAPRRLRWAFFESPTRFRIETIDPKMPGKRVVSVLALQGFNWKLVDVYYVTPT